MDHKGLTGQRYQLESKAFSSGGEGDVYGIVGSSSKVVKVYHQGLVTTELEEKLKIMVRRPPNSSILSQVAWPLDLVYDSYGYFCGFVMPRLSINAELNDIYGYPPRTNITYQQKLIIAQNICAVISEIHNAGYVFGDFNPNNIGINTATGRVAFLDTDSYHITDGNKTYRCKVCLDGYVAPELIKTCEKYPVDAYANAPLPTFTKETDNFALAIHIFKLLMNGYTPFNGIKETQRASTASPGVGNQAIKRDQYCFKPGNKHMSAAVPPIDVLPTEVADLFTRAFMDGRIDPKLRPSAYEWDKALERYEQSLVKCKKNSTHMYRQGLKRCPWCDADEAYKKAIAPTPRPTPAQKTFTQPVQPVSSYTPPVNQSLYTSQSTGGSTNTVPVRPTLTLQSFFQKYKAWIIAAAVLFFIFLVKSCPGSSTPKSSVEILTGDSTVTVGETIQIRIRSTTSRVAADYDADEISFAWGSTQQQSGGYYIIYANVTGRSAGNSTLKISISGNESVFDTISISVKSNSIGTQAQSNNSENQNTVDTNDGSSMARAKTLTSNTETTGSIKPSSGVMWYVLTLDEPGTVIFNMKYPQQEYTYSYWELYVYTKDNSSNPIMSCSYSGRSSDFSDYVDANSQLLGLDAGTYYVKITDGSYHSSATYTLAAVYAATEKCEMEPNASYGAASVLKPNLSYEGCLSSSSDVDWYVLTLGKSGTVTFNMKYSEREYSYSYWQLYVYTDDDSSKAIMKYSYDGRVSGFSDTISVDSQLLGLYAGRYYIKITDGSYHSSTSYTLTANFNATTQCEMEPNGTYGTASTLLPNVAYTGSLSSSNDVDWYVLVLDSSATVSFNMQYSEREHSYSYWELYLYSDSNSSRSILYCSYSGKQTNSNSDQITLSAGTYYVKITDGSYHSATPYTLTVKE